ncbi:sensor histidine kinase, partial [Aquipuribacter sp. SD81]|uniref:sensor histidine kinase n=1 Tax=Aquipuribacter sp. SD81 TaxID=3127703 RepID=UPI003016A4ED
MLRSAGIRSKILAVLVVPLVLLATTAGLLAAGQVQRAREARQVELLAGIGGSFAELVAGIAAERAVTAGAIQGDEAAAAALPEVRAQVDTGLERSRASLAEVDLDLLSAQASQGLVRMQAVHDSLRGLRSTVDTTDASLDDVLADYDAVVREDAAMPGRVATGTADPQTASLLAGFGHLLAARDAALREQSAGARLLAGTATLGDVRTFPTLSGLQADALDQWEFAVGRDRAAGVAETMGQAEAEGWTVGRARTALASPSTVRQSGLTPETWQALTEARLAVLEQALGGVTGDASAAAAAASSRATVLAALAVSAAVLGVGVTLLLSLTLSRRIVRPLRELTAAATTVRERLPHMVEQMRSPGDRSDVELPRIEVEGGDEVGELASAFNAVNDTVLEVAEEQAALRGAIAETFVNVARRNQVLLSRQLTFIDQLEQREEDPDTLENLFRLDHLATRMRRNAESLLVLAGIDAGRRLRKPLPLSDVIRTAASEIEQYERVNLALQVDPPTVGHLSLQVAHLLAELLENGTNFSEPHTPVLVATSRTATGIRVTVTDEGLGLTDDEIVAATAKIANAGADDVVTSQRLGFFVVGRLARKLGVTVQLRRGRSKGLVVTVDLPPTVFVPGTVKVAEVPAAGAPTDATPTPTAGPTPAGATAPAPAAGAAPQPGARPGP